MNGSTTKIKICGITNLEDAFTAASAGADYLGYIFFEKSKRAMTMEAAAPIISAIRDEFPHVEHVGVFVNESPNRLCEIATHADLDFAQLHGGEAPENCVSLKRGKLRVIKVFRFGEGAPPADYQQFEAADHFMCDTYSATEEGGTGKAFDVSHLPEGFPMNRSFLAGGLTSENVASRVASLHPYAVDVSTGVEAEPGRKSPEKIYEFLAAVHGAMR
jgi:phosphoribosylanthranilate isomerase